MKSNAKNIKLPSVDDLFTTEESRQNDAAEKVEYIPLDQLHPFHNHPFKVVHDEAMEETAESIRLNGVIVPAIARPDPNGGYELIAGHRRHFASQLAGLKTLPVIVKNLDDDTATLLMVDSNLQRENILPSERAFAYKLKVEALKHQGARADLTSEQVVPKLSARDTVAKEAGEKSGMQVSRFIRLTNLIPPLLDMVDNHTISMSPAYELSFLPPEEQEQLISAMEYAQATPSLSQAQRMKKFSAEGRLSEDVMSAIMSEEKKTEWGNLTLKGDTLRHYFPKNSTVKQMQEVIIKLLDQWQRANNKEITR